MDLTIHNTLLDTTLEPVHVGIDGGKIVALSREEIPAGEAAIDARNAILSPPFIDSHFHLENALIWDEDTLNQSGTLREAIQLYGGIKIELDTASIVNRLVQAVRASLENGVLWMRNHVDIDQYGKLRLLEGVVAGRKLVEEVFTIQNIAFPQHGLARNPEAVDLMWQAMGSGAEVVGGMPHGERDMEDAARHIEIAFQIAKKHDADVDMHVDETDDPYWHSLELLAEMTIANGYEGRVSASHCCAMAAWEDALFERVAEKVRQARLNIITLAPVNLLLQGRGDRRLVRRGIPRIRELIEAGVNVACGQDDLNNMFYPFGQMDQLEVANFVAHAAHLSSPDLIRQAFDMPRYHAAKIWRFPDYGIRLGAPANLILINAQSAVDAIRRQPERLAVIREGKILVRTERSVTFDHRVPT
ncbi:MAG: amidohydrolase family protein [Anaerolineales bacterium]|nr:amidohydrolase family protein [Anaerolineales bacterium]